MAGVNPQGWMKLNTNGNLNRETSIKKWSGKMDMPLIKDATQLKKLRHGHSCMVLKWLGKWHKTSHGGDNINGLKGRRRLRTPCKRDPKMQRWMGRGWMVSIKHIYRKVTR